MTTIKKNRVVYHEFLDPRVDAARGGQDYSRIKGKGIKVSA